MASLPTTSRPARPPYRYQHTQDFSAPSRSYPEEKYSDLELVDAMDEKVAPQSFTSGSSSHPTESRGHVRAASRDATSATSHRSFEPRNVPASSQHPHSAPLRTHPHRFHSHPPPSVSFAAHRQTPPVEVTTCCGFSLSPRAKAWIPFGAWVATSLAFVVAIAWWREDVFYGESGHASRSTSG